MASPSGPTPRKIRAARFSPDGRTLATGGDEGVVHLWDVAKGQLIGAMMPGGRWIVNLRFSPDGRTLLVGRVEGTARLYDVAGRKAIGPPLVHPSMNPGYEIWNLAFSRDGRVAITGSLDGSVICWDAATGRPAAKTLKMPEAIAGLLIGRDGAALILVVGRVHRLDLATGKPIIPPWGSRIESMVLGPDGRTLLTGGSDRNARLWDITTGAEIGPMMEHDGTVRGVAFSSDGKTIATLAAAGRLQFWDVATGKPLGPPCDHPGWAITKRGDDRSPVAFLPGDRSTVTVGGSVIVWPVPRPDDPGATADFSGDAIASLCGMKFDRNGPRLLESGRWAELLAYRRPIRRIPDDEWHGRMAVDSGLNGDPKSLAWHLERLEIARRGAGESSSWPLARFSWWQGPDVPNQESDQPARTNPTTK